MVYSFGKVIYDSLNLHVSFMVSYLFCGVIISDLQFLLILAKSFVVGIFHSTKILSVLVCGSENSGID